MFFFIKSLILIMTDTEVPFQNLKVIHVQDLETSTDFQLTVLNDLKHNKMFPQFLQFERKYRC